MTQTLIKLAADFSTVLTNAVAVGATSATLASATDSDGVALPTGTYGLTIDRKNSSKEYIKCTLTSTALTNIYSVSRQGALTSGFARSHRKGAEVIISDFAAIKKINDVLDGTTDLDAGTPLKYDGVASLTPASNELATVAYVDAVSIAGAADATTSTKGISKMSYAPASAANPIAVGDNDPRVPTQDENNALVGNNTDIAVGTGNKFVTQTGLQDGAEVYAASTTGNDTYVITLSPVPTALHNGMTVRFKPDTANTGAATLNVNSLGALSIVTGLSTALATGDIVANQVVEVVYNSTGTVWQLKNPASAYLNPTFTNGVSTHDSSATGAETIAHGLGKTPKKIRIKAVRSAGAGTLGTVSEGTYNGTTNSALYFTTGESGNPDFWINGTSGTNIVYLDFKSSQTNTAIATFDGTNITLTWSKGGSPTGTVYLLWEAEA